MDLDRPLSTITPTIDGDVLGVLARHDATFTTGQLCKVLRKHSDEGVRKVLHRLVKQGVVTANRVGNAYAYQLNRQHLAAEHIIGLARTRETLLARMEDRLAAWEFPPVYAAIFGSAARRTMTADSDLDVVLVRPVEVSDDRWESQVDGLVADVAAWTGNDVRPLEFTADEVVSRGCDEPVLRDVLDEGITLMGSQVWLRTQIRGG